MKILARVLLAAGLCAALSLIGWAHEDQSAAQSFTVKKGGRLVVRINGGDIRIAPWEKDEVNVKIRGVQDEENIVTRQRGNEIVVENEESSEWTGDAVVTISVPSAFDLDLHTQKGGIAVDGLITGEVRARTSAGDIHFGGVHGAVDAKTSGGDVRVGDVQGELTLMTSGGDITAGSVKGKCLIETSGGSIRVEDVSQSINAKTAGGDIEVGNVGGDATLHTAGGTVSVGKVTGEASLNTAGGDIDLQSASGRVKAKTAGGNLDLLGITGSVDGKTAGGDIDVELTPKGPEPSRLATAGGNVACYIPERAGVTISATIRVSERWKYAKDEYHIRSPFKADNYVADPDTHEIHATYTINGGGQQISLETVNADITIGKIGERVRSTKEKD